MQQKPILSPSTIRKLEFIKLPDRYWDCRLSELPDRPYAKTVKEYCENFKTALKTGHSLYLSGKYGTGKTGCAAIILKYFAAHDVLGLYTTCHNLHSYGLTNTEDMFTNDMTMLDRCKTVPLLVLDELDLKQNKKWTYEILEDLIRERIMYNRPTVICSNSSVKDLMDFTIVGAGRVLEGLVSVMRESFTSLVVEGKDFRAKKRQ